MGGGLLANDHAAVDVDDERQVGEPRPSPHGGEIRHSRFGWLAVKLRSTTSGAGRRALGPGGGALRSAAGDPASPSARIKPATVQRRPGDPLAKLTVHLADPVHTEVLGVDAANMGAELDVAHRRPRPAGPTAQRLGRADPACRRSSASRPTPVVPPYSLPDNLKWPKGPGECLLHGQHSLNQELHLRVHGSINN